MAVKEIVVPQIKPNPRRQPKKQPLSKSPKQKKQYRLKKAEQPDLRDSDFIVQEYGSVYQPASKVTQSQKFVGDNMSKIHLLPQSQS